MHLVSSYNRLGVRHLSAGFATEESLCAFLRARIGELAQSGSFEIVIAEEGRMGQRIYLTSLLLACVDAPDWSEASVSLD